MDNEFSDTYQMIDELFIIGCSENVLDEEGTNTAENSRTTDAATADNYINTFQDKYRYT